VNKKPKGKLLIIGGDEKAEEAHKVLETVAQKAKGGSLLLVTTASHAHSQEIANEYIKIFKELGVQKIEVLDVRERAEAYDKASARRCAEARVIFLTGGDQLRITSQMGDSPVYRCMKENYATGGLLVGTSAGAAVMSTTMIIGGPSDESNRVSALDMASGLGLLEDVVIDTHFAERGRIGRLLGAVAQNPRNLGIGLDAGTAILVEQGECFRVIGSGAVYLVDGTGITYSSLCAEQSEGVVTIHSVKLHVLGEGDQYDLINRRPLDQRS
jgi:cyanophycinase